MKQKFPVYRRDDWLKIHQKSKHVNDVMSSKSDKKQKRMCGFFTRLIENSALAIFTHSENFASTNRYYKATAPISTVLFTLSDKMTQRHGIVPKHR